MGERARASVKSIRRRSSSDALTGKRRRKDGAAVMAKTKAMNTVRNLFPLRIYLPSFTIPPGIYIIWIPDRPGGFIFIIIAFIFFKSFKRKLHFLPIHRIEMPRKGFSFFMRFEQVNL